MPWYRLLVREDEEESMNEAEYRDLVADCNDAGVSVIDASILFGFVTHLYVFDANKPLRADGTFVNVSPRDLDESKQPLILIYETISEMFELMPDEIWQNWEMEILSDMSKDKWNILKSVMEGRTDALV